MAKGNGVVTESYLDSRLLRFKKELKLGLKKDLYEIKDEIVGEIKGMREEFTAHQYSHARINDELADHEKRIKDIEAHSSGA